MKGTATSRIFQSPHTDRNGLAKIYLTVTINRKTKWYSLDIKCRPDEFDSKKHTVTAGEHKRAMNSIISRNLAKANKIIIDIIDSPEMLDFATFEKHFLGKDITESNIDKLLQLHFETLGKSRIKKYRGVIAELKGLFGENFSLEKFDLAAVQKWERYMQSRGNKTNTRATKHKCIIALIAMARKMGLYDRISPYDTFKIKHKPVPPVFLTLNEIRAIEAYQPTTERLQRIRRLFLFQINTGLRYSDLIALRWCDIDADGIHLAAQQKTAYPVAIPLTSMARAILDEMKNKSAAPTDCIFDSISNQKYNDYIKLLADGAGINKKITSHVARHTFATHCLDLGMPIEIVSKLLGHTDISTTQIYATITNPLLKKNMEKWDENQ